MGLLGRWDARNQRRADRQRLDLTGEFPALDPHEVAEGRRAFDAGWRRLHPFDQGWVQHALGMGEAAHRAELAPYVIGRHRRELRDARRAAVVITAIVVIGFVTVGLLNGQGPLGALAGVGSGGVGLSVLALQTQLRGDAGRRAVAANRALLPPPRRSL